jgi:hypothetical protein
LRDEFNRAHRGVATALSSNRRVQHSPDSCRAKRDWARFRRLRLAGNGNRVVIDAYLDFLATDPAPRQPGNRQNSHALLAGKVPRALLASLRGRGSPNFRYQDLHSCKNCPSHDWQSREYWRLLKFIIY